MRKSANNKRRQMRRVRRELKARRQRENKRLQYAKACATKRTFAWR